MAAAGKFYDFATRQSRVIQSLGRISISFGLSVSPDGKTFLYSVSQSNGINLMLVGHTFIALNERMELRRNNVVRATKVKT